MNRNTRLRMCISVPAALIWILALTGSAAAQTTEGPPATSAPPPVMLVPVPAQQQAPGQPPPAAPPAQPGQPYAQPAQPGQPYYAQPPQPGQPYYGQPPAYAAQPAPPPKPQRPRVSRGLMNAGISLFASTYAVGAVTGAILLDVEACDNCQQIGRYLFIPVAGPFVAMNRAEHARSMLAMFGLVQTAGAAMMTFGIIKYRRSKQRAEEAAYAFQLPRGRSLAVDVSTSPYRFGPQLSLRF